ncbi:MULTISPECIES: hypothetical protein [unclassified Rothia (in: high G+C Gram-positive bacteria)]|uniref:hypothetical protein n=1 Tax=unclassified Rothia (in: high G+C Gram-positive bacteria) TaxID=2689056 RepID=UPI00195BB912|nr:MULTISPECIES: hypothetical protein [unclassified Rothia (in: high G+C Gram-positive bacteria)]MBM7052080.1 hypothetical protein [Rothia sp. ZJ1223]QRZ61869.1 hypothetical protein JR346_01660 [Rothia sp. ZJ932]
MAIRFSFLRNQYLNYAICFCIIMVGLSMLVWQIAHPTYTSNSMGKMLLAFITFAVALGLTFLELDKTRLPEVYSPIITLLSMYSVQGLLEVLPHSLPRGTVLLVILPFQLISIILILRQRSFVGWIVFLFMLLLVAQWYQSFERTLAEFLSIFLVPALLLAVAQGMNSLAAAATQQTEQSTSLLRSAEHNHAEEEGLGNVASQRVAEVRTLTESMLSRIAFDPSPISLEEAEQFKLAEAQLRDTIRGRHIANRAILDATWAARQRGIRVDILDELGETMPRRISDSLTTSVLEVLKNTDGGTVTIRAFPADDAIAAMVVYDGGDDEDNAIAYEIDRETGAVEIF